MLKIGPVNDESRDEEVTTCFQCVTWKEENSDVHSIHAQRDVEFSAYFTNLLISRFLRFDLCYVRIIEVSSASGSDFYRFDVLTKLES